MKFVQLTIILPLFFVLCLITGCVVALSPVAAESEPTELATEENSSQTDTIANSETVTTTTIAYTRLFADSDGESHMADEVTELGLADMAPPAPPLYLSEFTAAEQFAYVVVPAQWDGIEHPAPLKAAWFVLSGELEIITSDGESRRFSAGQIFVAEDTTGKGHTTRAVGESEVLLAVVALAE